MSTTNKRLTTEEWPLFEERSMMPYITGMFKTFGDKLDKLLSDMSEMKTKIAVMESTRVDKSDCEAKHQTCLAKLAINREEHREEQIETKTPFFYTLSFTQYIGIGLGVSVIIATLMGALKVLDMINTGAKLIAN